VTQVGTIRAPAQTVFEAWTDAGQLQRWLAPIAEADGRVGGHFRLEVRAPEGLKNPTYRETIRQGAWTEALAQLDSSLSA